MHAPEILLTHALWQAQRRERLQLEAKERVLAKGGGLPFCIEVVFLTGRRTWVRVDRNSTIRCIKEALARDDTSKSSVPAEKMVFGFVDAVEKNLKRLVVLDSSDDCRMLGHWPNLAKEGSILRVICRLRGGCGGEIGEAPKLGGAFGGGGGGGGGEEMMDIDPASVAATCEVVHSQAESADHHAGRAPSDRASKRTRVDNGDEGAISGAGKPSLHQNVSEVKCPHCSVCASSCMQPLNPDFGCAGAPAC